MKKTDYDVLVALISGESMGGSRLKGELLQQLLNEHMLTATRHGSRMSYKALDPQELARRYHILATSGGTAVPEPVDPFSAKTRSELVQNFGDSKFTAIRSCPGFPVNVCEPLMVGLGDAESPSRVLLGPLPGAFTFISDWEHFRIPGNVVVVGVENMENFRFAGRQRHLFDYLGSPLLFASRYPQSGDFVRWLMSIPNRYVHFGDFDLAGIHIYLSEFRKYLNPSRCEYFIPEDIEQRLRSGSQERYYAQISRFKDLRSEDPRLNHLIDLIHKYRRGYDQEGLIEAP